MTTPIQVGLPQVILFVIALIGIVMLISAFTGLFHRRREMEIFEDESGKRYRRWRHRRRRFGWKRSISGVILALCAISLLWLAAAAQTYLGLTSDIKVATVQATQFTNTNPPQMAVRLILYDENGKQTSNNLYTMNGDLWSLSGDIVKFPSWMNIFGIHSGYKLTRLEGMYQDSNMERNDKHTVIDINGGSDNFFKSVYKQAWSSPFVDAAYGNGTFEPADDHVYDIYVSQTGLYAKPEGK